MNFIEAAIFILFIATVSVPIANRFRLPVEIFLVIGSCIISLIPGLPAFQINPLIVFNLFLPPILFYAAYFISWRDFKFNLRPISLLAFGLVICTTIIIGLVVKMLIPVFSWPQSFLVGAIISPTDATSATAIIKKLGAPRRLITVLEGESLINDATALLLFRFVLSIIYVGSVSITHVATQFFIVTIGGAAVGYIVGYVAIYLLQRLKNAQAETTLTFITAFACYMLGEHFGFSGVIATVVGGIYLGICFPEFAPTNTKVTAKASWNTLVFIINGFAFTLIGFELPWVLKNLRIDTIVTLILYALMISVILIIIRVIWVFMIAHLSRMLVPSIAKKNLAQDVCQLVTYIGDQILQQRQFYSHILSHKPF